MKGLVVLGSTGSIGQQTLDIVRAFPDRFKVVGLAAGRNVELLARQIDEFSPEMVFFVKGAGEEILSPNGWRYALMEEMVTEEGRVSTLSLGDYKMPTMPDMPELLTVLLEPVSGPAPFQSKGIGESSNTPLAGAIANAVYDAVGVRIMDLPITAEKVLKALKEKG